MYSVRLRDLVYLRFSIGTDIGLNKQCRSRSAYVHVILTHLSLASHKRNIGKQCRPRSDAAERCVRSGSTLFALNSEISTKHDKNKN